MKPATFQQGWNIRSGGKAKERKNQPAKVQQFLNLNPYDFSIQILRFFIKLQHQDDVTLFVNFWCKFLGFDKASLFYMSSLLSRMLRFWKMVINAKTFMFTLVNCHWDFYYWILFAVALPFFLFISIQHLQPASISTVRICLFYFWVILFSFSTNIWENCLYQVKSNFITTTVQ